MTTALIDGGGTLYCKACQDFKPISSFHKDSSSVRGHAYYCKKCATAKTRAHHEQYKDNPEYNNRKRNSYYKSKYSISLEERSNLLKTQDNKCAICSIDLQYTGGHTHTDHCHTTNKVRGILCTNCNRGLGHFQDSKYFLQRAIDYLEKDKL